MHVVLPGKWFTPFLCGVPTQGRSTDLKIGKKILNPFNRLYSTDSKDSEKYVVIQLLFHSLGDTLNIHVVLFGAYCPTMKRVLFYYDILYENVVTYQLYSYWFQVIYLCSTVDIAMQKKT